MIIVDELNYYRMICIIITKYKMHCHFLLQVVFALVKLFFLPLSFCFLG